MIGLKRSKYLSLMLVLAMLFTIVAPGVAFAATITDFTSTAKTDTTADFSWSEAIDASDIAIHLSTDSGTSWFPAENHNIQGPVDTTAQVTGLTANTVYQFKLVVTGGTNAGDSNVVILTTLTASTLGFADEGPIAKVVGDAAFINAATGDGGGAITYSSGTEATATVDAAGEVTIIAAGSTVITATQAESATHAAGTATYTLNVTAALTYALTLTGDNISSVPGAGNLTEGTSVIVTVAPAVGKQVATFTVGGVDQKAALATGTPNQYTFNMSAAATEVAVTYEDITTDVAATNSIANTKPNNIDVTLDVAVTGLLNANFAVTKGGVTYEDFTVTETDAQNYILVMNDAAVNGDEFTVTITKDGYAFTGTAVTNNVAEDLSEFAVALAVPGEKVELVAFNLSVTEAKDINGDNLAGNINVTVTSSDIDGEVHNAGVTFTAGVATVPVTLGAIGTVTLTVDVTGVTADQTVSVTVNQAQASAAFGTITTAPKPQLTVAWDTDEATTQAAALAAVKAHYEGITDDVTVTATWNAAAPAVTSAGVAATDYRFNLAILGTDTSTDTATNVQVEVTFSAALIPSTIAFADAGPIAKTVGDANFTNTATGAGDGAITYASGTPAVATVNETTGEVTIVGAGTTVITATQAESATHEAGTATYTLNVAAAADATVDALALDALVVAPVKDATPDTTAIDETQYTGTIAWFESDGTTAVAGDFAASTVYVAKATLTAKAGYTLTGVVENSFSYTGATSVANAADAGVVTITFPATAAASSDTTLTVADAAVATDLTGTVITVANGTYTQALVDALTAPVAGNFELQNADGSAATLDAGTTLVVDTMKVVVEAEDGTEGTYTIVVAAAAADPVVDTAVAATAVNVGQELSNSTLSGTFKNAANEAVEGTLAWDAPTTVVNATGDFAWTFIPTDGAAYNAVTGTVSVTANVVKETPVVNEAVAATAVNVGQELSNSTLSGTFKNAADEAVAGTLAWDAPTTVVNATGDFAWTFTPTDGAAYNAVTGTVSVTANVVDKEITAVTAIGDITVACGTPVGGVGLPATAQVTLDDNSTPDLAVTWDGGTPVYDGNTAGTYTFVGTLTLPTGVANTANHTATVNVIVSPAATYSVTVSPVVGGTADVTVDKATAAAGETVTVSIANIQSGKQFKSIQVNGGAVATAEVTAGASYTFVMPAVATTVVVEVEDIPVDKTALTAAITAEVGADHGNLVTLVYELTEADYTGATWTAYRDAIAAAIIVEGDGTANQATVDAATAAIATAKGNLVFAGQADLDAAVAAAGALTQADYTVASWADLTTALALPATTQAEVVAKTTAITNAIAALVLAPAAPTFVSAATSADGTQVIITFSKNMMGDPSLEAANFTVIVNGNTNVVTGAANALANETIELTVTTPITNNQTVTVAYTAGGVLAHDASVLASFAVQPVTNTVPAPTFTVTYDGNTNTGGAVPTDATDYEEGDTVTVLGNTGSLVKAGSTFAGWNTAADGSGTTYWAAYTFEIGTANVTLFAQWETAATIATTYIINNGQLNPQVLLTITGATFNDDASAANIANWTVDVGDTGITFNSVTRESATEARIQFFGTAAAGTVSIQANAAAISGDANSNSISIVVPAPATSPLASFTPVTLTQTGDVANNNVQYANAAAVIAALPTEIAVTLVDASVVNVPVTWAPTGAYNPTVAANYTFTATWGAMPAGANNDNSLAVPTVEVTVAAGVATYALTLTGENITSAPGAGNLTANTSVTVTVAPAAGKQVATFTVGGTDQKAALAGAPANQYTFNMPAVATEVVVTYSNITGHAANITTANVLIVGNYAFELNNASYTLNNYLTAAQTAWVNSVTVNYEIYYFANSKWYDLVKAETLGLVQAAEVDPSNINGNGLYTHANMAAGEIN